MSQKELAPWMPLAVTALNSGVVHDYSYAACAMQTIHDQYGPEVFPALLLYFMDTTIERCGLNANRKLVRVSWQREGEEEMTDADGTPAPVVWAGRLFGARLAWDEALWTALIESVHDDEEWSMNCFALLDVCASMLRGNDRG